MKKHCTDSVSHFWLAVPRCLRDVDAGTTTTTEGFGVGGIFGTEAPVDYEGPFEDIYTLVDQANLNISDIIEEFTFGSLIKILYYFNKDPKEREANLIEFWQRFHDINRGACYTFDLGKMTPTTAMQDGVNDDIEDDLISLTINFNFDKQIATSGEGFYRVFLHDSIHDRFDAKLNYPSIMIGTNDSVIMKIKKTNISSISTDESKCTYEDHYGVVRCKHLKVSSIKMW